MSNIKNHELPIGLHRTRWVTITMSKIDYYGFPNELRKFYQDYQNYIEGIIYTLSPKYTSLVDIHIKTTFIHFRKHLKSQMLELLKKHFYNHGLFTNLAESTELTLSPKSGLSGYDLSRFELIGVEEFSVIHIPFPKRSFGRFYLAELASYLTYLLFLERQILSDKNCFGLFSILAAKTIDKFLRGLNEDKLEFLTWFLSTNDITNSGLGNLQLTTDSDFIQIASNWDKCLDKVFLNLEPNAKKWVILGHILTDMLNQMGLNDHHKKIAFNQLLKHYKK